MIKNVKANSKLNPTFAFYRKITRYLNLNDLKDLSNVPKVIISENLMNRLQFDRDYLQNKLNWKLIIFSDESDLLLDNQGNNPYQKYFRKYFNVDFGRSIFIIQEKESLGLISS